MCIKVVISMYMVSKLSSFILLVFISILLILKSRFCLLYLKSHHNLACYTV